MHADIFYGNTLSSEIAIEPLHGNTHAHTHKALPLLCCVHYDDDIGDVDDDARLMR